VTTEEGWGGLWLKKTSSFVFWSWGARHKDERTALHYVVVVVVVVVGGEARRSSARSGGGSEQKKKVV
jgi:hypothetical protein